MGCTQDFGGFDSSDATTDTSPEADSASDVPVDVPPRDTGLDAGIDVDAGLTFACGAGTVTDCSQCSGKPQPCVYCSMTNAALLAGVCVSQGSNCFLAIPNTFQDCNCTDAATCPEAYQVCITAGGRCHTCSDNVSNNGLACQGGGRCDALDGGCN